MSFEKFTSSSNNQNENTAASKKEGDFSVTEKERSGFLRTQWKKVLLGAIFSASMIVAVHKDEIEQEVTKVKHYVELTTNPKALFLENPENFFDIIAYYNWENNTEVSRVLHEMVQTHPVQVYDGLLIGEFESLPRYDEILEASVLGCLSDTKAHEKLLYGVWLFSDKPYAEKVIFDVVTQNPKLIMGISSRINFIAGESYAQKLFEMLAQSEEGARVLIKQADVILQQPYGRELFDRLIQREDMSSEVLGCFRYIQGQPYEKDILFKQAEPGLYNVLGVLENAEVWKSRPYAQELFSILTKKDPYMFLAKADNYIELEYLWPYFEKFAQDENRTDYQHSIIKFVDPETNEFAKNLIIKSSQVLSKNDPSLFISVSDKIQHIPEVYASIEYSVDQLMKTNTPSWSLVRYCRNYTVLKNYEERLVSVLEVSVTDLSCAIEILQSSKNFSHIPRTRGIVERAVRLIERDEPQLIPSYLSHVATEPYIAPIALRAAERSPKDIFYNVRDLSSLANFEEVVTIATKKFPDGFLKEIQYSASSNVISSHVKNFDQLLEYAVFNTSDPEKAFTVWPLFETKPYAKKFAESNSMSIMKPALFIREYSSLKTILSESKNPKLRKMAEIVTEIPNTDDADETILLLESILSGKLDIKNALKLTRDQKGFHRELIQIRSNPHISQGRNIDKKLSYWALIKSYTMNRLHNEPDAERFAILKDATTAELYTSMVYAEEEMFTSTFNGVFDRFISQIQSENKNTYDFLSQMGFNKIGSLVRLCASYNRLPDLFAGMTVDQQNILLKRFVKSVSTSPDKLYEATIVADVFSFIKDKKQIDILRNEVLNQYKSRDVSPDNTVLYGLLASVLYKHSGGDVELQKIAEKYPMLDLSGIKGRELFNAKGVNVQEYFFYDDDDGQASFRSFLSQYKNQPNWVVTDHKYFVEIRSTLNTKSVEIYANKPEFEDQGQDSIQRILESKKLSTVVVVHRGHSYHVQKTIDRIPSFARIVSLGSCGGYNNLSSVIEKAPKAHVLSTKGTGTMQINEPLLKLLNTKITRGEDIKWQEFWGELEKKVGSDSRFGDYVPPHKNLGLSFLKAYNEYTKNDK